MAVSVDGVGNQAPGGEVILRPKAGQRFLPPPFICAGYTF